MKVTVTDYLYVRVGKPSLNAPNYQYLAPGSVLEVEDKLYDGDVYEGKSKWLKDAAGNYYWAGATNYNVTKAPIPVDGTASYNYWHLADFGIKELHDSGLTGEGVNVCIIDSGIVSGHNGFDYSTITKKNFLNNPGTTDAEDDFGHGTQCAGIIKSNGSVVYGVADKANLFVYKIYSSSVSINMDVFIRALNEVGKNIQVLSISFVIPSSISEANKARLKTCIDAIIQQGTVVVVAHGNVNTSYFNWLGTLTGVISVGAIDRNDHYAEYTINTGTCTLYAPGAEIHTTDLKGYADETLTSFATPFVASVCALAKQKKKDLPPAQLKAFLQNTAAPLRTQPQLKKIDPLPFINQII